MVPATVLFIFIPGTMASNDESYGSEMSSSFSLDSALALIQNVNSILRSKVSPPSAHVIREQVKTLDIFFYCLAAMVEWSVVPLSHFNTVVRNPCDSPSAIRSIADWYWHA